MELLYDKVVFTNWSVVTGLHIDSTVKELNVDSTVKVLNIDSAIKVLNKIWNLEKMTFIKGL